MCFVGGPDGDVAGNFLKIMQRDWPSARVVGVADGSGARRIPRVSMGTSSGAWSRPRRRSRRSITSC